VGRCPLYCSITGTSGPNMQGHMLGCAGRRAYDPGHRAESVRGRGSGLRVFREDDWSEDPNRGPASVVVTIRQSEVEHRVRIKDFENWLDSAGRSPAEMALKSRLRDIIGR
jgi:hypothetical protein